MSLSVKPQLGAPLPDIKLPRLGEGTLDLGGAASDPDNWRLIVVYRGKHCPLCTTYLQELDGVVAPLGEIGVRVAAISADDEARAAAHMAEVSPSYDVGYGLTVEQMTEIGLWISSPRNGMDVKAPFAEPGLFVTDGAGLLRMADILNVPFMRPNLGSVLRGIQFLRPRADNFPINGTFA